MAILLKRKRKAISVATIVCSPRNGEKAMKTPMEKASAVRSGGSSRASRRRNVARNICWDNKRFEIRDLRFQISNPVDYLASQQSIMPVLGKTAEISDLKSCGLSSKPTGNNPVLLKTTERLCFVVVGIKHGQEFGNHEEILDAVSEIQKLELATVAADGSVVGD